MLEILEKTLRLIHSRSNIQTFNMQKVLYILVAEKLTNELQSILFKLAVNFSDFQKIKNKLKFLQSTQNIEFSTFGAKIIRNFNF